MAEVNKTEASAASSAKTKITHFANISVVRADGSLAKLGAIPITENADKYQRTLIKAFEDGVDLSKLALMVEVRANVKSTDTENLEDWCFVTDVVEPQ